eukprot:CAMPEP_0172398842 /NCGR_PEP_ID=MMETSP1061-20121228/37907_1 /TAXON_ID=37318 /ORGANISM="Pseudo-nitzschia pungens, Strain cf. pungens" /LENGTH=292 /DNA_ID=CAMNT_0013131487 /DNA_START=18 /DNA_END=896 /DNA_ORIENTATION=+
MAGLPFLITAATAAYVVLFPSDERRIDDSSSKGLSPSQSLAVSGGNVSNYSFWLGVGVGMSFSWVASYEIRRRRLWQHVRLKLLSWLYDASSNDNLLDTEQQTEQQPLLQKLRKPCLLSELNGTPIPRKCEAQDKKDDDVCGQHLELVSSDWSLSSDLYCDIVRLPPGTELIAKTAPGVEFYYVTEGNGTYIDKTGEKHQISAGFGFIVDPDCARGFLVGGGISDLVLFRATDVAVSGGHNHVVRLQASSLTTTVAIVRAGLRKIHQLIGDKMPEVSQQTTRLEQPSTGAKQ